MNEVNPELVNDAVELGIFAAKAYLVYAGVVAVGAVGVFAFVLRRMNKMHNSMK